MKTIKIISQSARTLLGILIIGFVISSCNKDELLPASPPASLSNSTIGHSEAAINPLSLPYGVIRLNHLSARTFYPDYEVAVYSDLNVIFEGRRNTAFTGTKKLKIDEETFFMLKNMFISSHLFSAASAGGSAPVSMFADVPQVFTSFNNDGIHPAITLTDYYDMQAMPQLIRLRTKAEELLNIDYLVGDMSTAAVNH